MEDIKRAGKDGYEKELERKLESEKEARRCMREELNEAAEKGRELEARLKKEKDDREKERANAEAIISQLQENNKKIATYASKLKMKNAKLKAKAKAYKKAAMRR